MTASLLDTAKYNTAAANTVFDAVIDATALLAWRQNVKLVVDQHATEIDAKLAKSGDTMTGDLSMGSNWVRLKFNVSSPEFRINGGPGTIDFYDQTNSRFATVGVGTINFSSTTVNIHSGTGSPEGLVTSGVGSLFLRSDGGASTTLYVKQSGTGNTGWVAK